MDFFLWLLFAGAVIYLWRRTDALQMQVRHLEQALDGLRYRLASQIERGQGAGDDAGAQPTAKSADEPDTAAIDEPAANEELSSPIQKPVDESQTEASIDSVQKDARAADLSLSVIPAARTDDATPSVSKPARQQTASSAPKQQYVSTSTRFKFDFEDFFGRLLPIWAGGITLAVAGFFLVSWSIEYGLLGPKVRTALGFLFGAGLLGAAELAYRQEHRIADSRVRQALAGAGLATLYASFYLAGSHYGLVGTTIAFLGLAGVTAAAILLSFRFGLPSAILGLVGGFAAPMLVGSEQANLPMLALYLALVTGGLTYAGNKQGRSWLAIAALASGIGWGALMLVEGVTGLTDILAIGGYIVVLGAVLPAFMRAKADTGLGAMLVVRMGAAALAAIQMAAMVAQSGYDMLAWGLYGLLASALAFFAWREPRMREASAFAAALALVMLALWSDASVFDFTIVGIAFTAIFAGVPLANIWRDAHRNIDALQVGGFALGMIAVTYAQFASLGNTPMLALTCLAIAMLPALASWMLWPKRETSVPVIGLFNLTSAAVAVAVAGFIATPLWAAPLVACVVTLGLIAICWSRHEQRLTALVWVASGFTLFALLTSPASVFEAELAMLFGVDGDVDIVRSILRWCAALLPFVALSVRKPNAGLSHVADIIIAALVYGIASQFIPASALAWTAAALAIILTFADRERLAARLTFAAVALGWAVKPVAIWLFAGTGALFAQPMLIAEIIDLRDVGLYMLPLLAIAAFLIVRPASALKGHGLTVVIIGAGSIAAVTAHILFKHVLALETSDQFVMLGLVERTVWQALLLGSGIAVIKFAADRAWTKPVSIALFAGALAHFGLFTFILHNPLWASQAAGTLPIINLLLPAYGVAILATLCLRKALASVEQLKPWLFDAALMVLIGMLAFSELRQVFAGTVLSGDPVGQTEDLLRSVLGIVLAIGFLMWGARKQTRSWRIGSLVLMLAAVLKVFLLDASGLDGLIRIASFVALGFSLIGIGWFYSRQLIGAKAEAE